MDIRQQASKSCAVRRRLGDPRAMHPLMIVHRRTTRWPTPSQMERLSQAARRRLRRRAVIFRLGVRAALEGPLGLARYEDVPDETEVITFGEQDDEPDRPDVITFEEQDTRSLLWPEDEDPRSLLRPEPPNETRDALSLSDTAGGAIEARLHRGPAFLVVV